MARGCFPTPDICPFTPPLPFPLTHKRCQMKPWRIENRFTPVEVQRAFAALHQNVAILHGLSGTSSHPLHPFVHRRGGAGGHQRDHIELPLHHMYEANAVYQQLPVDVRLVCAGLHEAALAYAQEALREPSVSCAARDEILNNLDRKSVLRVLRYPAGSGCRPHVDPGLCTALLVGSAGGLEVSTTDAVPAPFASRPGDYTSHVASSPTLMHAEHSNVPDTLPHWEPVLTAHSGEVIVMAGNMLRVVSGGALLGVLHRVRQDWVPDTPRTGGQCSPSLSTACIASRATAETNPVSATFRFNIVVELRPAEAKRWYAAMSRWSPLSPVSSPPSMT
nr:unnamed protein product [Leishmania braziliensis]